MREARNILAADQISELKKLVRPSEFVEDAAQGDQQVDVGCRRQRRHLRVQARPPSEEVWLTPQERQRVDVGVMGAEIAQEIASSATVVTSGVRMERCGERIDGTVEETSQGML